MIRVAHLIGSLKVGGAENQVALLTFCLPSERFEVHLITFSEREGGFRTALPDHVRYFCMRYRRRFAPMGWWRLYRYLRNNRIDILQCHMYHASWPGAIIGRLAGVRVIIVTEHGTDLWQKRWQHMIERRVISPLTNFRVAVSEDIRRLRIAHDGVPANRIGIIENAVATDVPQAEPNRPVVVIGSLGRLVFEKDYPTLIRAVRILKENGRQVQAVIAGEGKERHTLQELIRSLDLEDQVKLLGVRPAADFFRDIDLFVMSSRDEGMPVALLEAMAHGLPIVATCAGGIPEVIRDGVDGVLCPIESPELLAQAIATMMDNRQLRCDCAAAARLRVVERYGIEQAGLQWQQLYRDLLGQTQINE